MTDVTLWTAVAAGVGAAISGLVAVVVTSRQVESTTRLAREARHQDRLERGYLTLMRYADGWTHQIMADHAVLWSSEPGRYPWVATMTELSREDTAFTALVSSGTVADLQRQFNDAVMAYAAVMRERFNELQDARSTGTFDAVWSIQRKRSAAVVELGDKILRAADAWVAAMRAELGAVGHLPPTIRSDTGPETVASPTSDR